MLKSVLCNYSDAYMLVKGTITVVITAVADPAASNTNKMVIFKNCAPLTYCPSEINNSQINNAKDIDLVMTMHKFMILIVVLIVLLIVYIDNYSKTSVNLWQYYKDKPVLNENGAIVGFDAANVTYLFGFKGKIDRPNRR